MENNIESIKKLRGIGLGAVSGITGKKPKKEEKITKTIRISKKTNERTIELYGKNVGGQGEVIDLAVALLYLLWKNLSEEDFKVLIKALRENEDDVIKVLCNALNK